jgi:hypothetical protein
MNTIQQTVTIPADRRLQVDLPDSVPVGQEMVLVLTPKSDNETKTTQSILRFAGALKNSKAFRGVDPVQLQKAMRDEW